MTERVVTKREVAEQKLLNAAYRHSRAALNALVRVKDKDKYQLGALRALYEIEDVLKQYTGYMPE